MPQNQTPPWLIPTIIGVFLASIRKFRRSADEKWAITIFRFIAHICTCMFAGYVTGGILEHLDHPRLIAPLCALAGLYGTTLVDWLENTGLNLMTHYLKSKIRL